MRRILLALFAALAFSAPAIAQQGVKADVGLIGGLTYDSTAGNIAGNCQALSGTFPKQTVTGAAGVDARTTVTEAVVDSDRCKLVTFSNAGAVAASIAQAGSGGNFNSTWIARLLNLGAGTVTLTPTTSTINGAATLALTTGQGAEIFSDGTNYLAQLGKSAGGGTGTVNVVKDGITHC